MRAIRIVRHGGPAVLEEAYVSAPRPAPGEVVVRNHVIGVNFVDLQHRSGGYYPVDVPLIPGIEAASMVVEIGDGVSGIEVGDRVGHFGHMHGVYAECTAIPAELAVPLPAEIDFATAAAVLLQGTTAHALADGAFILGPEHTALVHSAAGGTGGLLVQVARIRGAEVIATVSSPARVDPARRAGASHVIVRSQTSDLAAEVKGLTGGRGVDVVYDSVGRDTFDASLASLRARGTLVAYGQSSGRVEPFDITRLSGITGGRSAGSLTLIWASASDYMVTREERLRRSADVLGWTTAGSLAVRVEAVLPLAQAAEAHRLLESRSIAGKVLLEP